MSDSVSCVLSHTHDHTLEEQRDGFCVGDRSRDALSLTFPVAGVSDAEYVRRHTVSALLPALAPYARARRVPAWRREGGALAWIPRRVAKEAGHRVTNVTHAREPPQRRLPRAVVIANLFDSLTELFRTKIIPDYIVHVKIQRQF